MLEAIQQTLNEGGITIYALFALAIAIYATLFGVWRHLSFTKKAVNNYTPPESIHSTREAQRSYATYELNTMAWIERRLPFLAILISSAPLLGLLGTVAGMLITFSGMASGNSTPIDTISTGISRALVTTQAGLVIAIPAAFLLALLKRQAETTHLAMQQKLHSHLASRPLPLTTGHAPLVISKS